MNTFYLQDDHRKYRETSIREEGKPWVAFTLLILLLLMILSTVLNVMVSNLCVAIFLHCTGVEELRVSRICQFLTPRPYKAWQKRVKGFP